MKTIRRIWNIITAIIVALIVLIAIVLVSTKLFGIQTYAVLSGSMEPTYPVGCLLFVKNVPPETLREGDVITFASGADIVVTHRITEVNQEADGSIRFRTKGDANADEDAGAVDERNVIGTPVRSIPKMGYVMDYIKHPPGLYIVIALCALILLIGFVPGLFRKEDQGDRRSEADHH